MDNAKVEKLIKCALKLQHVITPHEYFVIHHFSEAKTPYDLVAPLAAYLKLHPGSQDQLPNTPIFREAYGILLNSLIQDTYSSSADSSERTPIMGVYNVSPPSTWSQTQMDHFITKGGYSRATPVVIAADTETHKIFSKE